MPQILYLLRHANARNATGSEVDSERPLDAIGEAQARTLGAWIRDNKHFPNTILCSSAQRTCGTLNLVTTELNDRTISTTIEQTLYSASARQLLHRIQTVPADVQRLMVIAHNPGIAELAAELNSDNLKMKKNTPVPPCTLIIFEVLTSWQQLTRGQVKLDAIIYSPISRPPADLQ